MARGLDRERMAAALAADVDRVEMARAALGEQGAVIVARAVARAESGALSAVTPAASSPKLVKVGRGADVVAGVVYMYPHVSADLGVNSCAAAGVCAAHRLCYDRDPVGAAARFAPVRSARLDRTALYWFAPNVWAALLLRDVDALVRRADRVGGYPAVRLNGLSDLDYINWRPWLLGGADLFGLYPAVRWWDYTRVLPRVLRPRPLNLDLTFSLDAGNDAQALRALGAGVRVAALLPQAGRGDTWGGLPLVDGDGDDWRWLDPAGCVVGLKPKGPFRLTDAGLARFGYSVEDVAAMRAWVRDPRGGLELDRVPVWAGGVKAGRVGLGVAA